MLYLSPAITVYSLVLTAVIGACAGSFINCWAWRMTHGESIMRGRSHCTGCNHPLNAFDLVPVFSWVASRGRCRYCGAKISVRYPATELLCAVVFVSIVARYDISLEALQMLLFACCLLGLSLTDIDSMIIPNGFIVGAVAIRVVYIVVAGVSGMADMAQLAMDSAAGAVALGGALLVLALIGDKLLGRESMGGGDIKLYAVAGLYFGIMQGVLLVVISCVLGIVFGLLVPAREGAVDAQGAKPHTDADERADEIIAAAGDVAAATDDGAGKADNVSAPEEADLDDSKQTGRTKTPFPFGPSIALACWIIMLAGGPIVSWYLGLFR